MAHIVKTYDSTLSGNDEVIQVPIGYNPDIVLAGLVARDVEWVRKNSHVKETYVDKLPNGIVRLTMIFAGNMAPPQTDTYNIVR